MSVCAASNIRVVIAQSLSNEKAQTQVSLIAYSLASLMMMNGLPQDAVMGEASEREYDTTLIFKHLYVHPFRKPGSPDVSYL
jgi:hypothetical protein